MGEGEKRLRDVLKRIVAEIDIHCRRQSRMAVSERYSLERIKAMAFKAYMDIPEKKETTHESTNGDEPV